jgi:hypothetical protein
VLHSPRTVRLLFGGRAHWAALRMDDEREAKKPRIKSRPSTPAQRVPVPQYKSASGWTLVDLQNCSVDVVQNIDALEMIPEKFFDFEHEHLEQYPYGSSPTFNTCLTN